MNFSPERRFPFSGFQVGPVLAGLILSTAILALVRAVKEPLTASVIKVINYFIRRSFPDSLPLAPVYGVWQMEVSYAVVGIVLLAIGIRLAFWMSSPSGTQTEN